MWLTVFFENEKCLNPVRFVEYEVLTAVVVKSSIFWDLTSCSPLKVNRRFGGTFRLHLHGQRIRSKKTGVKAGDLAREREERVGEVVRHTTFKRGQKKLFLISGFEGSRAVSTRPSGRGMFERGRSFRKRKGMTLEGKMSRGFTAHDRN
jgi:hypothetical protein